MIKFSILIPAYKSLYLYEAINSVVNQNYDDWELIVVDDFSPNNIKEILDKFSDQRISYYRNEYNIGAKELVKNWNSSLQYCTGDYVLCMGDDDVLLPSCLSDYYDLIQKFPDLNVYHAKTQLIDEESTICHLQESRPEFETGFEMLYNLWAYKRHQFIGDFLFSRRWLYSVGGYVYFPYAYSSDWVTAFWAASDKGIANGQNFMFQYRINRYTISVTGDVEGKLSASCEVWKWYKNFIIQSQCDKNDIYKDMVAKIIDNHFVNSHCILIATDIKNSKFLSIVKLLFWLANGKKYGVSRKKVLKSFSKYAPYIFLKINIPDR